MVEEGKALQSLAPGSSPYVFTFFISATPEILSQIGNVTYYLDPTFNPSIVSRYSSEDKFELTFTGWGKFDLKAKVHFKDGEVKDLLYPADKWTIHT